MQKKSEFQPIDNELLVKNKYLFVYLWLSNKISALFLKPAITFDSNIDFDKNDPKILLSNIAHLGDVILSTCILQRIKDRFPKSTIGFICNSGSKSILENHPLIDDLYYLDHWKHNRSKKNLLQKIDIYIRTFFKSLKDIKAKEYDVAIDLYYFYSNTILLLSLTNIPVRIGYTGGGFKSLLTTPVKWIYSVNSVMAYHHNLVDKLIPLSNDQISLTPILKPAQPANEKNVKALLKPSNVSDFIIFHCGAGDRNKLWNPENWITLTEKMLSQGFKIVFTGSGPSDVGIINQITNINKAVNLCNRLSFDDLSYLVKNCKMLVCVDTLIVHLGSAYNTPTVVICNNKGLSRQFRSTASKYASFDECDTIDSISVDAAYSEIINILKS